MIISQGLSRVTADPCQDQSGYACVCVCVSIYITTKLTVTRWVTAIKTSSFENQCVATEQDEEFEPEDDDLAQIVGV